VREITRTRLFAERALFVLQRMPFLLRLQADLLAHEVVAQPEVQLALTNTTRLSQSVDRISRAAESVSQTAAQLPDRISAERKEILAALDQQEGKLRDLAAEVNRSLVSADKMSASLTITITNFDTLMKRFGVGEPSTNAAPDTNSPPFNILDYGQVAQQVGTMAKDLNTLVSSVNQNVPQIERLSQTATGDAQKVVGHAFHLGLVLIAVLLAGLVIAGVVYRSFAERLKRTGRPPSPPNL
jgi:methyl-accepting chemotaxis protein